MGRWRLCCGIITLKSFENRSKRSEYGKVIRAPIPLLLRDLVRDRPGERRAVQDRFSRSQRRDTKTELAPFVDFEQWKQWNRMGTTEQRKQSNAMAITGPSKILSFLHCPSCSGKPRSVGGTWCHFPPAGLGCDFT